MRSRLLAGNRPLGERLWRAPDDGPRLGLRGWARVSITRLEAGRRLWACDLEPSSPGISCGGTVLANDLSPGRHIMFRKFNRKAAIAIGAVLLLTAAGAYAYWTGGGSG